MMKDTEEQLRYREVRRLFLDYCPTDKRDNDSVASFHQWLMRNRPDLLPLTSFYRVQTLAPYLDGLY
jgi:hypothetical protein